MFEDFLRCGIKLIVPCPSRASTYSLREVGRGAASPFHTAVISLAIWSVGNSCGFARRRASEQGGRLHLRGTSWLSSHGFLDTGRLDGKVHAETNTTLTEGCWYPRWEPLFPPYCLSPDCNFVCDDVLAVSWKALGLHQQTGEPTALFFHIPTPVCGCD